MIYRVLFVFFVFLSACTTALCIDASMCNHSYESCLLSCDLIYRNFSPDEDDLNRSIEKNTACKAACMQNNLDCEIKDEMQDFN